MGKGAGFLILGILAILGGAIFAALVIKNRLSADDDIDFDEFDDFDDVVDDDELEHFLGEKKAPGTVQNPEEDGIVE
ncbi:MAG: hypothetical protein FWH08_06515 [Oscillospiraceae bacterium]|nr:hypothetical protein [Oscillospiraceae bacterium]